MKKKESRNKLINMGSMNSNKKMNAPIFVRNTTTARTRIGGLFRICTLFLNLPVNFLEMNPYNNIRMTPFKSSKSGEGSS
jgi:hypothetical protein